MTTFVATEKLSTLRCASCHILFAVPDGFEEARRNDHKVFFCPVGHSNVFMGESEAEKFRRERDRLVQHIAQKDDEIVAERDRRETAERRMAAARGQVTKIKNRVGHGVCPCCNRTFENLHQHMNSKHPTFIAQAAE